MAALTKRFADDGTRLTDCCGAYSTFHDETLCCKACNREVEFGQGDGSERRISPPQRATSTKEGRAEVGESLVNAHGAFLGNLCARWADEREYEDWKDYEKVIRAQFAKPELPAGYTLTKTTKRPFGVEITGPEGTFIVYASASAVGWKFKRAL